MRETTFELSTVAEIDPKHTEICELRRRGQSWHTRIT